MERPARHNMQEVHYEFLFQPLVSSCGRGAREDGEDYGEGGRRWRLAVVGFVAAFLPIGPSASPGGVFCVSLFFEVEEWQLRSRREKRRGHFSECRARGFSRWEEEEEEEWRLGVGGQFLI